MCIYLSVHSVYCYIVTENYINRNKNILFIYCIIYYLNIFSTDTYYLIKIAQTDSNQYFKAFTMTTTYYIGLEIFINKIFLFLLI